MFNLRTGSIVHVVADNSGLLDLTVSLVEEGGGSAWVHPTLGDYLDHLEERRCGEPEAGGRCLVIEVGFGCADELQPLWFCRHRPPVVVIAAPGDVETAVQVMKDGALDCIEPPVNPVELLEAVVAAVERDVASRVRNRRQAELHSRAETLTSREREVMSLIAAGTLNKVIASKLGLSRRTVETHRTNVMHKMNADSVVQLINMSMSLAESATGGGSAVAPPPPRVKPMQPARVTGLRVTGE